MAKDKQDTVLPTDPTERKNIPIASGVLDYFPAAIAYIAKVSKVGNDQHNPGEPLHWARGKSMDHPDTIMRHFMERGTLDKDGLRHTAKAAWRMLALLQEELEREEGAPVPRGARETGLAPVVEAMNPRKWRVPTNALSPSAACGPRDADCNVCWRDAEPGEIVSAKTAVLVTP